MTYLKHLYELRKEHEERLRGLEKQQATYGISADPRITNEIEGIRNKLADIERQIAQECANLFKRYEYGFGEFLRRLTPRDPHRDDALKFQEQLNEFMKFVREGGDSEARAARHKQLVRLINDLAIKTTGTSFYEFCGISPSASASDLPAPVQLLPEYPRPSTPSPTTAGIASGSIDAQNVVFGDQTNIGSVINIKTNNNYNRPKNQKGDHQEQ